MNNRATLDSFNEVASLATYYYRSPVGILRFQLGTAGLRSLEFIAGEVIGSGDSSSVSHSGIIEVIAQLDQYFKGENKAFPLDLDLVGTEFQIRVWNELLQIEYGTTISYQELANRLGDPTAVRAVGLANGKNPIAIIVPCHRVIGSNGSLVGYGGGLDRKRWLLQHEMSHSAHDGELFSRAF